jgi:excisionase family DNA binding protein
MSEYLTPDEVDERLKLPRGKAARLARRGKLPACVLPDGTIRFPAEELESFLRTKDSRKAVQP